MINYIWIGLIILAVGYGSYRDISGDPVSTQADAIVLANFDDVGPAGNAAADATNRPADRSFAMDYDFTTDKRLVFPLTLPVEKGATTLAMDIQGEGGNQLLLAQLVDAEGAVFYATFSQRVGDSTTWKSGSFALGTLTAADPVTAPKPVLPLTLEALELVQPANSERATGRILVDNLTLKFPVKWKVKDALQEKSWMGVITKSATEWTNSAVTLALGLIGTMALWLGILRIAERAGLVQKLANALKPIMVWLFPGIPPDGEAMGAIVMNIAANMMGLGNAATPMGLKAMEELQKLNPNKAYATNAMCMLLSVNTSSVQLVVPTLIGYRAAAGSTNIMSFYPVMILATLCSTVTAITVCKVLEKLPIFAVPPVDSDDSKEMAR